MSRVDYEYGFDPSTPNNTASHVYRLARSGGLRVLDLGSGPGIVSSFLQVHDHKSVTCLDSDPDLLNVAAQRGVGRTVVGDLNDPRWYSEVEGEVFDVVILADVLEHLIDPGRVLDDLLRVPLLAEDGCVVVSIPNAAHEGVISELVSGNFTYRPTGLLDETHIRFFTLESFRRLIEGRGYMITHTERTTRTLEQTEFREQARSISGDFRELVKKHSAESEVYQYVMRLAKVTESALLEEKTAKIESLQSELASQHLEVEKAKDVVGGPSPAEAALESSHRREMSRLRSGQVRRLLELDRSREQLEKRVDQELRKNKDLTRQIGILEKRIKLIYESNTWMIGSRIRRLVSVIKPGSRRTNPSSRPVSAPPASPRGSDENEAEVTASSGAQAPHQAVYQQELDTFVGENDVGIGFAVSTRDFGAGRGDLFVAVGLGRFLRRLGYGPTYVPVDYWYDASADLRWLVAMMPAFRPSQAPQGPQVIGWVRNEIEKWLEHPELDLFDALFCSSQLVESELRTHFAGPIFLLPLGVDVELFTPDREALRSGVVSTVNQWGRERDVYRALRSSPIEFPLRIIGQGIGLPPTLHEYHEGLVDFFALPAIYSSTVIVLDDFNHTTVGWGAVNSRVFEAIAAGAIPITNSRLGLEMLGLELVPTYSEPQELNALVEGLLGDQGMRDDLIGSLSRTVRERHTFEQRASEFHARLIELEDTQGLSRVLAFFPDYRAGNPYQEMLYSQRAIHRTGVFPLGSLDGLERHGMTSRYDDLDRVLHLHWTAPIVGSAQSEAEALIRVDAALSVIDQFRSSGGHLVWTIHNALPHEVRFRDVELHLRNELSRRADLVHVMCAVTSTALDGLYELPQGHTVVIEHSGYVGVYPDVVDRDLARSRLGVDENEVVLLAIGGIRPYKGLDRLLAAFDRAWQREPRLRLIVAGKPGRFPGITDLQDVCDAHPRVISNFNEILSSELQHLFKAADVAVLSHRVALNSGALLLAYTFGLPVIAPKTGCIDSLLVEGAALGFDPASDQELEDALVMAPNLANGESRRSARALAEARPIETMSNAFFEALAGLKLPQ